VLKDAGSDPVIRVLLAITDRGDAASRMGAAPKLPRNNRRRAPEAAAVQVGSASAPGVAVGSWR
jgi:hypothetical protein